jgi:hypothetical protein
MCVHSQSLAGEGCGCVDTIVKVSEGESRDVRARRCGKVTLLGGCV